MLQRFACFTAGLLLYFVSVGQDHGPSVNLFTDYSEEVSFFSDADTIRYNTPLTFCEGGSVILIANNAPAGASFNWKKDNVTLPSATTASLTVTQGGSYTVIVTSGTNSVQYDTVNVVVHPRPEPAFSFTNNPCAGVPVSFSSNVTGGLAPYTYSWNFDDGGTAISANPSHVFESFGCGTANFSVTLTVTDARGCSKTVTNTITVKQRPEVTLRDPNNLFSPFSNCVNQPTPQNPNYSITVENTSPNASCITSYSIDWGDGNTQNNISFPINHTYTVLGAFNMVVTATGANGCTSKKTYVVANQTNPAGSLGTLGSTTNLCAPATIPFTITNWQLNSPGTSYILNFGDGQSVTMTHPLNVNLTTDTVDHTYTTSSCPLPTYTAELQVVNACANTPYSAGNIQISTKPQANFTTPLNACVGVSICFNNTTLTGNYGPTCSSMTLYTWDFGDGTTGSSSQSPCHTYTTPGTYTVTMTASNPCGTSTITRQVCVVASPVPSFTLDQESGCGPLTIAATNTSNTLSGCSPATYQWVVTPLANSCGTGSWSFTGGTTASSVNPSFLFSNAGSYSIRLNVTNACGTFSHTKNVTIKAKPNPTFGNIPAAVCQNGSVTPTATVNNCYATTPVTYAWSFPGGTPASSTQENPGPIVYNTPGNHTITLTVTNECGSNTITRSITVNPAPTVSVPADLVLCAGTGTGALNFTSNVPGAVFNWTNSNTAIGLPASGTGSIASFIALNNTASPLTANISVVPVSGCSGSAQNFSITVNPAPSAPQVTSPVNYCLDENAAALTATGTNTLTWYDNVSLNNGSTTAPVPNTSVAGVSNWYVTQTNTFNCKSPAAQITVNVLPAIQNNLVGPDQDICSGNATMPITPQQTIGGGNNIFTYQWQSSTDGGVTWTPVAGATSASYSPGSLNANTHFRRIVTSGGCADTSNTVHIQVQGSLNGTAIASSQTICAGTAPALISGEQPTGGSGSFIYQWEQSTDNSTWTTIAGATSQDYQPPVLNSTMHYRRKTSSGSCAVYSASVTITVNPVPVTSPVEDLFHCHQSSVPVINLSTTPASNTSYTWINDNTGIGMPANGTGQPGGFTALNTVNPKVPSIGNIALVPAFTQNNVQCFGDTVKFRIVVLPVISIAAVNDTSVCTGSVIPSMTPVHDAEPFAGASVTYTWTVSSSGISLLNGSGNSIPSFTTNNPGSTDLQSTVTIIPVYQYNGKTCNGLPEIFTVTVKPGVPQANAGPDMVLCANGSYTMQAVQPAGATGGWTQLGSTTAVIVNPALANTVINGLVPGTTYQFVWTVSGFASCAPTKDTLTLTVTDPLINNIDTDGQTICSGQSATLTGFTPTGGNGVYLYQWQQSIDNINWANISGATTANLVVSPLQTSFYRRIVISDPCTITSSVVQVTVQPAIANNLISASQSICINTAPSMLTGDLPTGGNGVYQYQWQFSTDGGTNWTSITGATGENYNPGVLNVPTQYRRLVSTALCSGPQSNTSNIVAISINPDAVAMFNPTDSAGCVPFQLNAGIINLQSFPQNSQYVWYVNDQLLGTGAIFPGYTMTQSDDSISIKLVTQSGAGCLADSISRNFYTLKVPLPSFTISDSVGCGPLTVQFNNTTPGTSEFAYEWNFGNGQTSTLVQPGAIIFQPNPNYNDTSYVITLSVITNCDTYVVRDTVRVKSKPKALFAPDQSVGCSPMTVVFNNISGGIGNQYTWYFGDGSQPVSTTTASPVSHTFHSGVQDTFYVKLVAVNECGSDSLEYAIVVSPNQITLDFALNGNQFSGCSPHTVDFINNTTGATHFTWNFGDGNIANTTLNIDTVSHTYLLPGTYLVTLTATNGCSDTTTTETIIIYPRPVASFTASVTYACIGESIQFNNQSQGGTAYSWNFGGGQTSTLTSPVFHYTAPGNYTVRLVTYSFNTSGTICTDTAYLPITIVDQLPGSFSVTDTVGHCIPFTVGFTNHHTPSVTAIWDFGDGNTATGNQVNHTYTQTGNYIVTLTVTVPGGCTYTSTKNIKVEGPSGSWTHNTGYVCSPSVLFQVNASHTDSLLYDFGDGSSLATISNVIYHQYTNPGTYFPRLVLKNDEGCMVPLPGLDSIRIDRVRAGFSTLQQKQCGSTIIHFTDTSFAFFGKSQALWNFGDGHTGTGFQVSHTYDAAGTYPVQLIVIGTSGCSDTLNFSLPVEMNYVPVAEIIADNETCERYNYHITHATQSTDPISFIQWNLSNGFTSSAAAFDYNFTTAGTYTIRLVAGTVNGCFDTVFKTITVKASPTITASNDLILCRGSSASLTAVGTGIIQYNWLPLQGLNCYDCQSPIVTATQTANYLVRGTNSVGCSATDSVLVTVIQPLHVSVAGRDSICLGTSTQLNATGATSYSWSPATGLNNTAISNPTASPTVTTTYRVVGYDGFNCFTDTAFITIAVGQHPTVNLGPDQLLATGTQFPLNSVVQNGPVSTWQWTPATDLSCDDCALPIAHIKKEIAYEVKITTAYGCTATDSIRIKTFCEKAQVFVPNAFTPNADGVNDVLMVRASGIAMVKTFRIFNRWGEVVFERSGFQPNDPQYGWDGRVKGVKGGPDVYVYTAEVVCENGSTYTYKGNVTLLK